MATQVLSWRLARAGWSFACTKKDLSNAFGTFDHARALSSVRTRFPQAAAYLSSMWSSPTYWVDSAGSRHELVT